MGGMVDSYVNDVAALSHQYKDNLGEDCSAAYHDLDREWTVKYAARLVFLTKQLANVSSLNVD